MTIRSNVLTVNLCFSIAIIAVMIVPSSVNAWDTWGVTNSGNPDIGNYIWTVDSATGDATKVSTKLFANNTWIPDHSYVDSMTGKLFIKSSAPIYHVYDITTDTWEDRASLINNYQGTFPRAASIADIAGKILTRVFHLSPIPTRR